MTATPFCPGYAREPFRTLAREYPGADVYPAADFRVEWGPIFHRGRLDGTARVLILGQDPAAQEAFARRILCGTAGHRVQGFLAKLGVTRRYVLVNTFLYSVYGQQGGEKHKDDAAIAAYRHRWLDALLVGSKVEAVVAFGSLADRAWKRWTTTAAGQQASVAYVHLKHPTWPDSASGGNAAKQAQLTRQLLTEWNAGLVTLKAAVAHPDRKIPLVPYGTAFLPGELVEIPPDDFPAGLPPWVRGADAWAARTGTTAAQKRRTLTVTIPA